MPKFKHREVVEMFSDEILEKIFAHKDMRYVPIGYQSTVVTVVGEVLEEYRGKNKYAAVSELLSDTDAYISRQLSATDDEYV
jgi:hypothetical protein